MDGGVSTIQREAIAQQEKEKGNEAFYSKDFREAELYYSRSIMYNNQVPSVFGNRCLCRLKQQNYDGALEDAETSLKIDPANVKAMHRKGKALYELQR